jgi:N-acetylgalactosamine-N,N'-diacetylbacillosaminyl-diphospho-undecaprenol 4-alpha-N-acetylgalactosaminyltransferase
MKTIFIFSYSLCSGGAEKKIATLSNFLSSTYNVIIVVYDNSTIDYEVVVPVLSLNVPKPPYNFVFFKIFITLFAVIKLFFLKIRYRPHFCISFLDSPNYINVLSLLSNCITNIENIKSSKFKGGFISRKLVSFLYNLSSKVVCASEAARDDIVNNFNVHKHKTQVINNIFDLEDIQEKANAQLDPYESSIFGSSVILMVGRLVWDKCQWYGLRAFEIVKCEFPDLKLVIVGDGEMRGYLNDIARNSPFSNDIIFMGFKDNPFKYMKNSTILLHTSPYEGFGNIFIEAMACSLPIVSVDCVSSREILFLSNGSEQLNSYSVADCGVHVAKVRWKSVRINDPYNDEEINISNAIMFFLNRYDLRCKIIESQKVKLLDFEHNKIISSWLSLIGH